MKRYTTNDMLLLAWLTTIAALCGPAFALLPEAPKPLKQMPATSFTCAGKVVGGYYADVQAGCRVFHVCTLNEKGGTLDIPFLCVDGTVFDQKTRVCERVDEVDCSISESFYHLNNELYGPGIIPMTASESEGVEKPTTQHALDPTAALMGLAITSSSLPPPSPAPSQESSTPPGASSNSPFTSPSFNSSSSTFFDFTSIPVEKQRQQQSHGVSSTSTVVSTSTSSSITTTLTPPDPPFTISRTSSSTSVSSSSRVQIETPLAQISLDQGVDHSSLPAPHLRQTLLRLALQAQNAKVLSEHERARSATVTLDPPIDFEEVPRLSALSSTSSSSSSSSSSHDPIGQPVVPPRQKRQSDPLKQPAANPVRISSSRLLRRPSSASPRAREEVAAAAATAAAVAAVPARASRPPRPRVRGRLEEEGRERAATPVGERRTPSRRVVVARPSSAARQPIRAPARRTSDRNAVDQPFRREFGPPDIPAAVGRGVAPRVITRPGHRTRPSRPDSFVHDIDRSPLTPEAPFADADLDLGSPPQEPLTTPAPTPAPVVLPVTNFSCDGRVHGGLYADTEAGCELYHVCSLGPESIMEDHRFLCGSGTLFDQVNRICRAANEVNCAHAPNFYHLNNNPLQAVILSETDFPEHQFDFPRVRRRRDDEVLNKNQYLCDMLRKDEASGESAVRCAFYFLCNTYYIQEFKQCENDIHKNDSQCLSQKAVQCMEEISGYQEDLYGVLGGSLGRRRRSALPSVANLVVVPGTEDARVRRALFSLAALQLWVKENAMHSSFIDMQTIRMKNGPFVKKVEGTTRDTPENKMRVLTRLRRQLSDVRDSGDSAVPQTDGEGTSGIENTTTSSTVAPTTTTPISTTVAVSTTASVTPSPELQETTEDVPVTSLGPADDPLDPFEFTTLPTLTKVTTPTTPVTTVKTETPSSISPPTTSKPAQDASVLGETSTSAPSSSAQPPSLTAQDSTPGFVDTTTAISQAKSSITQLPETSTSNDLPVQTKDQIGEAVDDGKQERPILTTSRTSSTSATSTLATMSSLPSTSATPVNMIPATTKASSDIATTESQEPSPVDIEERRAGENENKTNTTESSPASSVEVTSIATPVGGTTSNSTEPTPSPDVSKHENGTDTVWNETSPSTPKPGQLFTRDNLPETSFTCKDKQLQRFYPDPEVNCQVFHYCSPGFRTDQVLDLKFLCTGLTMFDVETQKCEDMKQVTCSKEEIEIPHQECNETEVDKVGDEGTTKCVKPTLSPLTDTPSTTNTTEAPRPSAASDNNTSTTPSSEPAIHNQTTDGYNVTSIESTGSLRNETSDVDDSIHRNTSETQSVPDNEPSGNDGSQDTTKVDDVSIDNTTSSDTDAKSELPDTEEIPLAKSSLESLPVNESKTISSLAPSSSEAPKELLTSPNSTEAPTSSTSPSVSTLEPDQKITSPQLNDDSSLSEATNNEDPVLTSDTVQIQEATEEVLDKDSQPTTSKELSVDNNKNGSSSVGVATTTEKTLDPANETGSGSETTTTSVPLTSTPAEPKTTTRPPQENAHQGHSEPSDPGPKSTSQPNNPTSPSPNISDELSSHASSDSTIKADTQNDTGSAVTDNKGQEASEPSPQPDNTRETVPELSQADPSGEGQEKSSDKAQEQETIGGSSTNGAGGASTEAPAPTTATPAESS